MHSLSLLAGKGPSPSWRLSLWFVILIEGAPPPLLFQLLFVGFSFLPPLPYGTRPDRFFSFSDFPPFSFQGCCKRYLWHSPIFKRPALFSGVFPAKRGNNAAPSARTPLQSCRQTPIFVSFFSVVFSTFGRSFPFPLLFFDYVLNTQGKLFFFFRRYSFPFLAGFGLFTSSLSCSLSPPWAPPFPRDGRLKFLTCRLFLDYSCFTAFVPPYSPLVPFIVWPLFPVRIFFPLSDSSIRITLFRAAVYPFFSPIPWTDISGLHVSFCSFNANSKRPSRICTRPFPRT